MTIDVIIPTMGGREKYLRTAMLSALSQCAGTTVIVSNNGAHPNVRAVVDEFGGRIRYFETPNILPMPVHWDFALSHSTAQIVTIIGDDDALMPGSLSKVLNIFDNLPHISAVTHKPAQYYWPDFLEPEKQNLFYSAIDTMTGNIEEFSADISFQRAASFQEWYGSLPYLYHGFVHRSALEKIAAAQGGKVFLRAAPDIYSDFAIAANIIRYVRVDDVLTVGGQGAKSNGVNFAHDTTDGKKFMAEMPEEMRPDFSGRSVTFHIYDASLAVMSKFGLSRTQPLSWRRFVDSVCREAVLSRTHRDEILSDLLKISRHEYTGGQHMLTLGVCGALKLPFVSSSLGAILRWRERNVFSCWKNAFKAGNVTDAWELAQWLNQKPRE